MLQRLSCATPPKHVGWSQGITRFTVGWHWGEEERDNPVLWVVPLEELKRGLQVQETFWSKDFYAEAPQVGLLPFLALLVSVSALQTALGGIWLVQRQQEEWERKIAEI